MAQEPAPRIAVRDLDPQKVGETLIRLGVLSHAMAHEYPIGTLRPYCNKPGRLAPEAQFVYDMFCRRTPQIIFDDAPTITCPDCDERSPDLPDVWSAVRWSDRHQRSCPA